MDILFETVPGHHGDLGLITLNRPHALNALTYEMIKALQMHLDSWRGAEKIKAVVIRSNNPKAFCAGGDIRALYEAAKRNDPKLLQFFWDEYRLNATIHNYPKPYISLLNGMTMGGGVGISLHGSHPVALEQFSFAMPETAIGFFPDIGGCYLLNRCKDSIGSYLGLTGRKIKREDAVSSQLIKYCVASEHQHSLLNALCDADLTDNSHHSVTDIILKFHQVPLPGVLVEHEAEIKEIFSLNTMELILEKLSDSSNPWCQQVFSELKQKSPTSLKITLAQLRKTKGKSLTECLQLDYRMVGRILQHPDFNEGVRALIIDKDNKPRWATPLADEAVERFFEPLTKELEV